MSSPFRNKPALVLTAALVGALALTACDREKRDYRGKPLAESGPAATATSTLLPGQGQPAPPDPRGKMYEGNAFHINQGKRWYAAYNCVGCHAHGGGGMGPALIDDEWRYGGSIDQIYASIADGRPNGMPSWKSKLSDAQMWQLAAYVRSISGNAPPAASGSRGDEMTNIPPPDLMKPQKPKAEPSGVQATAK